MKEEELSRHDEPSVQIKSLVDAQNQVVGDPTCKLCHGTGRLGVTILRDGNKLLRLCRCGSYGETPFTRVMKEIGILQNRCNVIYNLCVAELNHIEKYQKCTFWGGIEYIGIIIWNHTGLRIYNRLRKRVSVKGEAKA